jgi:hypothetical protein
MSKPFAARWCLLGRGPICSNVKRKNRNREETWNWSNRKMAGPYLTRDLIWREPSTHCLIGNGRCLTPYKSSRPITRAIFRSPDIPVLDDLTHRPDLVEPTLPFSLLAYERSSMSQQAQTNASCIRRMQIAQPAASIRIESDTLLSIIILLNLLRCTTSLSRRPTRCKATAAHWRPGQRRRTRPSQTRLVR